MKATVVKNEIEQREVESIEVQTNILFSDGSVEHKKFKGHAIFLVVDRAETLSDDGYIVTSEGSFERSYKLVKNIPEMQRFTQEKFEQQIRREAVAAAHCRCFDGCGHK